MKNLSNEFIKKILKKEKETFNKFYFYTVDSFYRYLKNSYSLKESEIDDIISTTYFKIRKWIDNYKSNNFTWWIRTILRNTTIDFFKKSKEINFWEINSIGEEKNYFEDNLESEDKILENIEKDFEIQEIEKMIEKLTTEEKEIIYMKFIEEKSYKEISQIIWIKYDNIRKKISRTIKKLKKISEEEEY